MLWILMVKSENQMMLLFVFTEKQENTGEPEEKRICDNAGKS